MCVCVCACVRACSGQSLIFKSVISTVYSPHSIGSLSLSNIYSFVYSMRQDVFESLVAVNNKLKAKYPSAESKRYVERLIKLGKRNGIEINAY